MQSTLGQLLWKALYKNKLIVYSNGPSKCDKSASSLPSIARNFLTLTSFLFQSPEGSAHRLRCGHKGMTFLFSLLYFYLYIFKFGWGGF